MKRLDFETLLRVVIWDYNRCFKDESLDKDLFIEKYGKVMGNIITISLSMSLTGISRRWSVTSEVPEKMDKSSAI